VILIGSPISLGELLELRSKGATRHRFAWSSKEENWLVAGVFIAQKAMKCIATTLQLSAVAAA
jgi:hypothetical protein